MRKLLGLSACLWAASTFAAASQAPSISQAKVGSSAWEKFKEKSYFTYFGEFNDHNAVNSKGQNDSWFYQSLSGRYVINDTWTARADMRFETIEGNADPYYEYNPRIGIQGLTYSNGNFSVFSVIRLELPLTNDDPDLHKIVKPRIYNALSYEMGAHSFSTGIDIGRWLYEQGHDNKTNNPAVTDMDYAYDFTYRYTYNDKAALQGYYEMGAQSRRGKGLGDFHKYFQRYLLGMDFTVAKNIADVVQNVTVYPHLDYRPDDDREVSDLGAGVWISASFFR